VEKYGSCVCHETEYFEKDADIRSFISRPAKDRKETV
jgi:hypothetical protein